MDSDSVRGADRRRLLGWGGLAAAGVVTGASLMDARPGHAEPAPAGDDQIPPATLPGGAYDRYVAKPAAEGRFCGVVLLSHRGRTVLSRGYGTADEQKGIAGHAGTAYVLTAAEIPHGPRAFGAYGIPVSIVNGKWMYERAGGNPGVAANRDIRPYTGWVGVILGNRDGVPLQEMIGQETRAITGTPAGGGSGG